MWLLDRTPDVSDESLLRVCSLETEKELKALLRRRTKSRVCKKCAKAKSIEDFPVGQLMCRKCINDNEGPQHVPLPMPRSELAQKQIEVHRIFGEPFQLLQEGSFSLLRDGRDCGDSFIPTAEMDGSMLTMKLSTGRSITFRFWSIVGIVWELAAFTLLQKVKILEGGWLYMMNGIQDPKLQDASQYLELQIVLSMAVWVKGLRPQDLSSVFPFHHRDIEHSFQTKELNRISDMMSLAVSSKNKNFKLESRSLAAITLLQQEKTKGPYVLPEPFETEESSKKPAWWKIVDSIW